MSDSSVVAQSFRLESREREGDKQAANPLTKSNCPDKIKYDTSTKKRRERERERERDEGNRL